jgi:hypothetical protein
MTKGGWPETASENSCYTGYQILSPDNLQSHQKKRRAADSRWIEEECCPDLPADSQSLDDRAITLDILFLQVVQQTSSLTDDLEKTPTGMMIFLVGAEMLSKIGDALGQKSDLHLRRPGVSLMGLELFNDFLLAFRGQHCATSFE